MLNQSYDYNYDYNFSKLLFYTNYSNIDTNWSINNVNEDISMELFLQLFHISIILFNFLFIVAVLYAFWSLIYNLSEFIFEKEFLFTKKTYVPLDEILY